MNTPEEYLDVLEWINKNVPEEEQEHDHVTAILEQLAREPKQLPVLKVTKGKSIDEALAVSNKAVAEALGGLPPIKMHCSVLAEDALKSAIDDYLKKQARV